MKSRSAHKFMPLALAALAVTALVGCTQATTGTTGETDVPTSSPVTSPTPTVEPTPDPFGGPGMPGPGTNEPSPTPTTEPSVTGSPTTAPSTAAAKEPPRVDALRIGEDDYTNLDWNVTCGGTKDAPSVLGTAEAGGNQYVFMLLASGADQLLSFTFSYGPAGAGHASKTGLTVTPAGGQGNGTFTLDGSRVISDGRGISYSPDDQDRSVDTLYTAEFTCDDKK